MALKISDILSEQGLEPQFAGLSETVAQVAARLRDLRIGVILVLDKDGGLAGIVSERDIVRATAEGDGSFVSQPAVEIGTKDVVTCSVDSSPNEVYSDMLERKIRHMPVLDGAKVVGMVSMTDLLGYYRNTNSSAAASKIMEALSAGAIRSSL